MRILHVTPYYLPAIRYGGPVRSIHALAAGAVALGHEVHVFTTDADGPNRLDVATDRPVMMDGVHVHYFRMGRGKRLHRAPAMRLALVRIMGRIDIVHLHTVFLWPTLVAARIAAHFGVPYVLSPRGMLVKDLVRRRSRLVKSAWITAFERRTIARAAAINVTSATEQEQLAPFRFRLPPVFTLPNGVGDPEPFDTGDISDDVATATAKGNYVLFFGRLGWEKNLGSLIRAMASVAGIRLIIAGFDERGQAAELVALIAELGLDDQISLIARDVTGADREQLFTGATLFCLPSFHENFGNVVLEAMIRGVPVLVGDKVGAADAVLATKAGRVTAVTPEALAVAITGMLDEPEELARMGERGLAAAKQHYGWRAVAAQSITEYEKILAGRR